VSAGVALALFAHPDDAEILCAGTLLRLRSLGWRLHLCTATAGECGSVTESPAATAARRLAEARRAAELLGASYHCLGLRDGYVVYSEPALERAVALCRELAPTLVLTHAPRDYHLDHEQTSLLARGASFLYAAPNASALPLAAGARVPYLYHADALDGRDALGNAVVPTTWVDISAQLDEKARLLACHESQREWLRAHHGTDEYLDAMRRHAALRGAERGVRAAEVFVQHRGHPHPGDDLLARLLDAGR
jgi:LmbE family N-acetylglucosaminyl deacetylase